MTTPAFTFEGLDIRTLTEINQELIDGYKAIYGNDINLEASTPDGQRVGIEAKAIADIEEFLLNLYNQMDSDLAFGEWLNKLIKFAGIQRKPATRSTVEMEIVTDRILTLPANYTLEDELGQEWIVTANAALVSGTNTVTFVSKVFGANNADANTITVAEVVDQAEGDTIATFKTQASTLYSLNRLNGTVTYADALSRVIKISGDYLPMSVAAYANQMSRADACDMLDTTVFGDTYKSRMAGLKSASGTLTNFYSADEVFGAALTAGVPVVIEDRTVSTDEPHRTWALLDCDEVSGAVDGVQSQTVSWVSYDEWLRLGV
jgi:hypothetical protein